MNRMPSGKKILYFDCFSGISGDMACGALADLTGREDVGSEVARNLGFDGVRVVVAGATSFGIRGKRFEVACGEAEVVPRSLATIRGLFEDSALPGEVISDTVRAFTVIAEAESRVHGIVPDKVHFHEIGAIDSIVDIATFFSYLHVLKPDIIYCSELPPGMGSVTTDHGTYPIPAPATLEIVKGTGAVFKQAEFHGEAVTPTGAALIVSAGARFEPVPPFTVAGAGYGVGQMVIPERPNVLRAIWGEAHFSPSGDRAVVVETNVDDMSPQHVEMLMERMFEMGALDFYITPVQMKKNRPGWVFTAIASEQEIGGVVSALFSLSTTTGIRIAESRRVKLRRERELVETSYGSVAVKVIEFPDGWERAVPEYDDVKRIAAEKAAPVHKILQEVDSAWRKGK